MVEVEERRVLTGTTQHIPRGRCSYLEIYNGRIFDLLDDIDNDNQQFDFAIVETKSEGTVVRGLRREEVGGRG